METPRKLKTATGLQMAAMIGCLLLSFAASAADLVPFSDITATQAAALIKEKGNDPLFKVIDVRTAAEFAENRIAGSLPIDVKAADFKERVAKLDKNGTYLAVCRGGVRSARAMNLMKELGFKRVFNLAGGLMSWQNEKFPLETAAAQAAAPAGCSPSQPGAAQAVRIMGPGPGSYAWLDGKKSTVIPFRLFRNHIHIEAEISGRKLDLILDTGMPAPGVLLLGGKEVEALNLAYAGEARIAGAGGGSSPAKVATGIILKFGDLLLKEQTAIVKTEEAVAAPAEKGIDKANLDASGVIGHALFSRFVVAIDHDRMTVTLSEPADFNYQGQGSRIPLAFESNFPFIDCAAQLTDGKSVSLKMIVDLGASHALSLNLGAHPEIQTPQKSIAFWGRGAGGEVSGRQGRIRSFSLGNFVLNDVVASFYGTKLMPLEKDGNLGNDVLRRFNLIFDYSRKTLIIEPNSRFKDPFEAAMSGFQAEKSELGEFVIRHILPDSPASEAKLQENDRIMEINGLPAAQVSTDDLQRLALNAGRTLALTVARGDARFSVILKLRRLI